MDSSPTGHRTSTRATWWFAGGVGAMVVVLRRARAVASAALLRSLVDELTRSSRPGRLAPVWITADDVRRAALDRRARVLRSQASGTARRRAAVDLTGTWRTPDGAAYRFDQYGDRLVLEEWDGDDVVACGVGLVSGTEAWVEVESADGSEGEAWLSCAHDRLSGETVDHESGRTDVVRLCRNRCSTGA